MWRSSEVAVPGAAGAAAQKQLRRLAALLSYSRPTSLAQALEMAQAVTQLGPAMNRLVVLDLAFTEAKEQAEAYSRASRWGGFPLFLCVLVGGMIVLSLLVLAFTEAKEQAKAYSRASRRGACLSVLAIGGVADGAGGVFSCGWGVGVGGVGSRCGTGMQYQGCARAGKHSRRQSGGSVIA